MGLTMQAVNGAEEIRAGVDGIEEKCMYCHPAGKQIGGAHLAGGDGMDGCI
jgi:hypothetical protein